ncbi:MAG: prolyl oligopeptidase family serine peptidase [Planctomycetota bacterium]
MCSRSVSSPLLPSSRQVPWLLFIAIFSWLEVAGAAEPFDPRQPGPYPVGVTTMTLVDHSRVDPATQGPRTLLTEIWYPATDETKDLPKNQFSDFLLRGTNPALNLALQIGFKANVEELNKRFTNLAVRDARVREGKFPLILFSHGNGGIRQQSTFLCDYLASHGYVVMSPDHTGNAAVTVVDGKLVTNKPALRAASAEDRPKDLSFLIDCMTQMNKGSDSRFAGKVDLDRIGAAGHSFGGYTVGMVINAEPRIKAIVPLSPVFGKRENFTTPVLVILGTEDATIGVKGNDNARAFFEESKGPHYLVEILDGGHFTFSDMFQIKPDFGDGIGKGKRITKPEEPIEYLGMKESYEIINSYSTAFFGKYVKGMTEYDRFLASNEFPQWIAYKAIAEPSPQTEAVGNGK